jgi:hypothetical protein
MPNMRGKGRNWSPEPFFRGAEQMVFPPFFLETLPAGFSSKLDPSVEMRRSIG